MLHNFLQHLKNHASEKSNFLLTVSGGVDSVVMAHLFYSAKLHFSIAHCNFQLRGNASDEDEFFVKDLAQKLKVPCFTKKFDTKKYTQANKLGIQVAARRLRYTWFDELATENAFDFIVTAHHKNDVAETALYNLSKGTGIRGLHGIKTIQNKLLRPLLFCEKNDIIEYAAQNNLSWREDASNKSNDYSRNFIRNNIIPLLERLNPSSVSSIHETTERLLEAETLLIDDIKRFTKELVARNKERTTIDVKKLLKTSSPLFVLSELLIDFKFTYRNVKEIVKSIDGLTGSKFHSPTHTLYLNRKELIIIPNNIQKEIKPLERTINESTKELRIDKNKFNLSIKDNYNFKLDLNPENACLDFDKIKFPLLLRPWQRSDRFKPIGMNGFKKVSDFLIDEKIPLADKQKIFVLISNDQVCWVVGMRTDERFKIKKTTQKVLHIKKAE